MFDLDQFIADCRHALTEPDSEVAIRDLVARAVAQPSDIESVLGAPRGGGISTLHHSPQLTILNIVWAPGMAIYPHEHRMWAAIGLYRGREDNTFYRRSGRGLVVANSQQLQRGDTALLGSAIIHAVTNPRRAFTGAVHVYGGDFFATPRGDGAPDTFEERPFVVERARRVFAEANERWRLGGRLEPEKEKRS